MISRFVRGKTGQHCHIGETAGSTWPRSDCGRVCLSSARLDFLVMFEAEGQRTEYKNLSIQSMNLYILSN